MRQVYALRDPTTRRVKYVGQTKQPLQTRLCGHISRPVNESMAEWLEGLVSRGLKPKILLLETVPKLQGSLTERKWIRHFVDRGEKLLNGYTYPPPKEKRYIKKPFMPVSTMFATRLIPERFAAYTAAAESAGLSLGEWVRKVADMKSGFSADYMEGQ